MLVGLAGLLLLLEPVVEPLAVGGARVPAFVLGALVFVAAMALGAVVFARRGRRVAAVVHGGAGAGLLGLVAGPVVGPWLLVAGVALLVAVGIATVSGRRRGRFD